MRKKLGRQKGIGPEIRPGKACMCAKMIWQRVTAELDLWSRYVSQLNIVNMEVVTCLKCLF